MSVASDQPADSLPSTILPDFVGPSLGTEYKCAGKCGKTGRLGCSVLALQFELMPSGAAWCESCYNGTREDPELAFVTTVNFLLDGGESYFNIFNYSAFHALSAVEKEKDIATLVDDAAILATYRDKVPLPGNWVEAIDALESTVTFMSAAMQSGFQAPFVPMTMQVDDFLAQAYFNEQVDVVLV